MAIKDGNYSQQASSFLRKKKKTWHNQIDFHGVDLQKLMNYFLTKSFDSEMMILRERD